MRPGSRCRSRHGIGAPDRVWSAAGNPNEFFENWEMAAGMILMASVFD